MGSIGIVTDSTADLQPELQERFGLAMVPLIVNWDGQTFRDKLDLSTADFYQRLRTSKSLPKTGAPSLAASRPPSASSSSTTMRSSASTSPSSLSGTFEVAQQGRRIGRPAAHLGGRFGHGLDLPGLVGRDGRQLAQQGLDRQAIVEKLEEARSRLRIFFLLETLEFLQRGGRIGRAAALAGTLLSVKPILSIRDGEVAPVERVRTMNGALRRLVELVGALGPIERLGVVDGDAAANTAEAERQFQARITRT